MSTQQPALPRRIERKLRDDDHNEWYEYQGDPLFNDTSIERLRERFRQMNEYEWEPIATVKGSNSHRTKIRTKDLDAFRADLTDAHDEWVAEYGEPLTAFGNVMYGDQLTEAVEVVEENPRKTIVAERYDAGRRAFLGGAKGKRQKILLPVRSFEQWLYHTEVVEPLFSKYHEKYPY